MVRLFGARRFVPAGLRLEFYRRPEIAAAVAAGEERDHRAQERDSAAAHECSHDSRTFDHFQPRPKGSQDSRFGVTGSLRKSTSANPSARGAADAGAGRPNRLTLNPSSP